ncbi:RT34 protein, partial [Ifrita kowaldi]|nr:RT34 protein [Ifrita kowaldi]
MTRKKLHRPIAAMAKKIREYRALKDRPRDSQRFAVDCETMRRPLTQKRLPVRAWEDVRNENRLFALLCRLPRFGVGRTVTRKSWLILGAKESTIAVFSWKQILVMVLPTGVHHLFPGKTEEDVREIDKAMYHDWRMVPKHEEEAFKKFTPVPEKTVLFLPYPPLLRAMILAQWQKEGKPIMEEPVIDLEKV